MRRALPPDAHANDAVHRETRLVARDRAAMAKLARTPPVVIPDHALGFARAVAMRDPDGHTVEIVEP